MMNPAIQEIGWVVLDLSQGNFANDVVIRYSKMYNKNKIQ
jgi:hypothetical protein